MDRVATLGDAAEYIEELHETIETYNDEIRALESEACNKSYVKSKQTREIAEKATPVEVKKLVIIARILITGFALCDVKFEWMIRCKSK